MKIISVLISGCLFFSHDSLASQKKPDQDQDKEHLSNRMHAYGIPQNIRTGTVHGEALGVAAPGAVMPTEHLPIISADEIRFLAESKVNSATHLFMNEYSEAVVKFVPQMFLRALSPKTLNEIGFHLDDTMNTLAMRFENLAFKVRDELSDDPQKDSLMALAFLLAAQKLSVVEKNIDYQNMGSSLQDRQEILEIKIDYKLSVAHLTEWAQHHNKALKLDSYIQKKYLEAMTLLPFASLETQAIYEPLCRNWFDKLSADQQWVFIHNLETL